MKREGFTSSGIPRFRFVGLPFLGWSYARAKVLRSPAFGLGFFQAQRYLI
jgi:hypothetical protein